MPSQDVSYFDIIPQWHATSSAAVFAQQGTSTCRSMPNVGVSLSTESRISDSNYCVRELIEHEAVVPVDKSQLEILAERIQELEHQQSALKKDRDEKTEQLESRLRKTAFLCASLLCINLAVLGLAFMKFMAK
ncbi:hypothetical protein FBEOM_12882 [Fusarium beomiforme]|uniref:Transmembrane protein n=1 Tax=Fusarium beomiforme TaxID=44412 RepID=A0A9P5DPQ5_9HYPO|nr:hypothetical protein FBEOM_12882 [Fusarium beomiforme]